MNRQTFTAVYPHQMRPSQYDGAHFICYLNESSAEYRADEEAEPTQGFAYIGTEADGGTLVECDAWNRDKLINGIIRTRYLQTEEDAIKTHRLQLLSSKLGMVELSEAKATEYEAEWAEFEAFRAETIALVDTWGPWE